MLKVFSWGSSRALNRDTMVSGVQPPETTVPRIVFLKSHIKGYNKKDGTYVSPHETKAHAKPGVALFDHKAPLPMEAYAGKPLPAQQSLFPTPKKPASLTGAQFGGKTPGLVLASKPKGKALRLATPQGELHPQAGDKGEDVYIKKPSQASAPATWADPAAVATFLPDGEVPGELNGVAMTPWEDAPTTTEGWASVPGQLLDLDEPLMPMAKSVDGKPKERAAGVIIEEADGRVWLMRPTNGFGGYDATFPKGRAEPGLSLQASAIKEAFEETGMRVEITGYWGDIERTTTVGRYYRAKRVGGSPAHMGWEAQAVQLVPRNQLAKVLNTPVDRKIIAMRD